VIAGGVAPAPLRFLRRTWTAADASVHFSVNLHRTTVESGCAVAEGARLRDSLLLPGARIGEGSRLDGCVVGPGAVLPPETRVRDRMVCRRTATATVPEGSSVVGDLIYAPLDPQTGGG
jgi:mannose-1-phosphate guanylyltransferase